MKKKLHASVHGGFPCHCDQICDRNNLWEEGFTVNHRLMEGVATITGGSGHIAAAVRKQSGQEVGLA